LNYEIWLAGDGGDIPDTPIGYVFRDPWQRPTVGQEIRVQGKIFKVLRSTPSSNPDNAKVIYYVESPNDNWPYKRNS
jgi:hypothetical protein